ncbi:tetratricopeptide repeat protein [Sulfurivermis fontis]|uniref:tetratricopeptide repeat protein n=1 Tax=Sulfurivermis fontis TaxID=1972068 RepID=UPI000FDC8FD6|nr:tetratricopeptide repeat protein [Sulfurivermis fontis]
MSLINDMLRDLEARRAKQSNIPAGLLQGMGTPPTRGGRRPVLVALGAIAVVLAATVIWLAWQRYGAPARVAAPVPAVVPAVTEQAVAAPGEPPVPATAAVPSPVTTSATQSVPAPSVAPVTTPVPAVPAPRAAAPAAAAPVRVEKTARAPTPSQQAEIDFQRGVNALRSGNHAQAESAFRTALWHDAGHLLAREMLAAMLLGAGRLIEADDVLEQGRRFFARNPTLALLLARLRVEQGQTGAAVTILEQSLHAAMTRPDYLAFLAALYQRELRYEESVESYGRALALQPQQATWWVGMGISLENAGRRADAVKAYEQAAEGSLPPQLQEHVRNRLKALQQ